MRMKAGFMLCALCLAFQAQAQEIYNPVPGALAVNAQLEHDKGKATGRGDAADRKAIREEDFACRLRVVNAHARGSAERERGR